jgi:hypothetical protein
MSLAEYFSTGPPFERPIFDAVMSGLAAGGAGPIHVEPVSVGIFLKRPAKFAELRPMVRWTAISFALPRTLRSARISRKVIDTGARKHHVVNVHDAAEVDQELVDWLLEAYHFAE